MSSPQPGSIYTVVAGDTLNNISVKAYGTGQYWPRIFRANITGIQSGDPDLIEPGEKIIIPTIPELSSDPAISPSDLDPDKMTLRIKNRILPLESCEVFKSISTAADEFSAVVQWEPGRDPQLDRLLLPYQYNDFVLYIGRTLAMSGLIYGISPDLGNNGTTKTITGNSYTADMVDSTMRAPYEFNNVTLEQLADQLIKPLGISVNFEFDGGGKFDRVTASPEETYFDFFSRLARQRGLLLTASPSGFLIFTKAKTDQPPVLSIAEGVAPAGVFSASFNGRKRYAVYKANSDTPGSDARSATAKDLNVPRSRFRTFDANETTAGNVLRAAEWARSKQIADSLSIKIPVKGWYSQAERLWMENQILTAKSETLSLPQGFNFLIRSVKYTFDSSGNSTELDVVPPQVYTGDPIEDPWAAA